MPRIACKSVSGHKVHVKSRSARVCKQQQTSPKNISGPKGLHTSQPANVWCSLLGHAPGNSPVLPEQGASTDNLNQSGQAQRHNLIPASLHKSIGGIWRLLFTMLWFWWKGEKKIIGIVIWNTPDCCKAPSSFRTIQGYMLAHLEKSTLKRDKSLLLSKTE